MFPKDNFSNMEISQNTMENESRLRKVCWKVYGLYGNVIDA